MWQIITYQTSKKTPKILLQYMFDYSREEFNICSGIKANGVRSQDTAHKAHILKEHKPSAIQK